ncbi:uncharacterized protein LOC129618553 [Condylostylus longicornis]|uniref:uncharacterized protein LOC129618553 n=1 Tax=Condylostylus longicornis TaxID=2530218 RepID=UPI00244E2102|nr:uncharacterized protein LOC129618553 [Condylostylus longicornis]
MIFRTFLGTFLIILSIYIISSNALRCYTYQGINQGFNNTYPNRTCTYMEADQTKLMLYQYFENAPTKLTNDFKCISIGYRVNNDYREQIYKGCSYNVKTCGLKVRQPYKSFKFTHCKQCSWEFCNYNPANRSIGQLNIIGISSIFAFLDDIDIKNFLN